MNSHMHGCEYCHTAVFPTRGWGNICLLTVADGEAHMSALTDHGTSVGLVDAILFVCMRAFVKAQGNQLLVAMH